MKKKAKCNISEDKKITSDKLAKIIIVVAVVIAVVSIAIAVIIVASGDNKLNKHLNLGNKYLDEMKYEEAIAQFEIAIKIDPMNTDAYIGIADAYIGMGDYQSAIDVLNEGIGLGVAGLDDKLEEALILANESAMLGGDDAKKESENAQMSDNIDADSGLSDNGESSIKDGIIIDEINVTDLLNSAVIDGKHISEWTVDELIAYHGLEYNGTNYQSVGDTGEIYQVAYYNDGGDCHFDWYTNKGDGSYHYSEVTNATSGDTYYDFGYSEGSYMPAEGGLAAYAMDNGMTNVDGFLKALGISEETINEMRNSLGTEFVAYEKMKNGTSSSWHVSINDGGIDGDNTVTLWTNGIHIYFNRDIARKVWISYGPGKNDIVNWK